MTRLENNDTPQGQLVCEERRRLSDALLSAIHNLMELQSQQSNALIADDTDFSRFDDLIYIAQNSKNNAKYALLAHIQEHRCE